MLKNYLKIALRNIIKYKGYSFINITGLAVGMACCILIFLYIQFEFGYDQFHKDADKIYRVAKDFHQKGEPASCGTATPPTLAPVILNDFPGVEHAVRLYKGKGVIKSGEKKFIEEGIFYADASFFNIFTFPFIKGNPETALKDPYSAVLTEETAKRYFNREDPLGKTISFKNSEDFKVTGVIKNVPINSHFKFDILFSFATLEDFYSNRSYNALKNWWNHSYRTYIKISSDKPSLQLVDGIYNLSKRYVSDQEARFGFQQKFFLQPLRDIYLKSNIEDEMGETGNIAYLYIFMVIAIFILIIACINFVNLATARSAQRAHEVGMRKVVGAVKTQLVRQFLVEALMVSFASLALAIFIVLFSLPLFNDLTGKNLELYFGDFKVIFLWAAIPFIAAILSGCYPAFFLSAFKPIDTLKGAFESHKKAALLRKGMVVFQFAISIILIVGTLVVSKQLDFMRDRDPGFKKEQVMVLSLQGTKESRQKYEILKNEFSRHSSVISASASSTVPGRLFSSLSVNPEGYSQEETKTMYTLETDYDFIKTLKIELSAGRYLSRDFKTDPENAFILNEAAVFNLGWGSPKNAIGKNFARGRKKGKVIGVIKDFHFESLHKEISPLLLYFEPDNFEYLSLRIAPGNIFGTISFIENKWQKLLPGDPFNFFFLDDDFDRQYRAEEKVQNIFRSFTIIAIVIACLGLFGLAAFTTQQRFKEIGIRKVLGASAPGILLLLAKEFIKWVLLSNLIAWPIAYFAANKWLQNFAYRTDVGIWTFLFSALAALTIALLTVSYQAVKAAIINPMDVLKYE
jgi:putative ABC transport system permease protein